VRCFSPVAVGRVVRTHVNAPDERANNTPAVVKVVNKGQNAATTEK